MKTKWKVCLALLLCFFSANAFADELLMVKLGYQSLSPSGSIAGTSNGIEQKLDVDDDLNLGDSEDITAEIALQWGNGRLSFNYLPIDFSGTGTLTVAGTFNGQNFSVSDRVQSKVAIDLYDFGYTYYFLNMDDLPSRFQLGLELAVKVADADVSLRNLEPARSFVESESVTAPIPTIGARTRIALADFIGLTGRIGYLEYDDNYFLDAEAQIEFSPLPTFGIYGGYRYFEIKLDESDVFVETDFSGPFAGAFIRF